MRPPLLDQAFQTLRSTGWFSQIDPEFQSALAQEARLVHAAKGENLFNVEEPGAGLFGIVGGSVLIGFPREDGVFLPLSQLGIGYWLGDLAALSGKPGLVSIETQVDVTAVNIPARKVRKLVDERPEFYRAFYLLNYINMKLALRLLAAMTVETTDMKIGLRILILQDFADSEDGWLKLTHGNIAEQLGLSRPSVERSLKRLVAKGFLETRYSHVRVVDRTLLKVGSF